MQHMTMKHILMLVAGLLFPICGWSAQSFTVQVSGAGKPIILIPGLACSGEVWDETVKHLNAEGYQTHTLTLAGFGGNPPIHTDDFLLTVRRDLADYIQAQHLDKPVVIGHSLGGFLALWLAEEDSNAVGKVISVDGLPFLAGVIQPGISGEQARQMGLSFGHMMTTSSDADYAAHARQSLERMITSPENVNRELKYDLASDRPTVAEAMAELMGADIRPGVKKIKCPVLEMGTWIAYKKYGATHDTVAAMYQGQFNDNSNVTVVLSDQARHFIQLDDAAWFYAQVDAFLGK